MSSCCVVPTAETHSWMRRVMEILLALGVVMLLAFFVWPWLSYFVPRVSVTPSFLALLAFGMVASVSTCLASTGAFVLAYTTTNHSKRRVLFLHLGRFVAFMLGGALLGGIGSLAQLSSRGYGVMAVLMGLGFLMVGLHVLGLSPSLASIEIRMPSSLSRWTERWLASSHPRAPFLMGAATFLLPCGFTQAAQAMALVSGSAVRGSIMMIAFAMGTLPILLGITLFASATFFRHSFIRTLTGVALLLFAIGQFDGGLTVLGANWTISSALNSAMSRLSDQAITPAVAQEQVVSMTVAYGAFSPNYFVLHRNVPVTWQIEGVDISGCADTIIVPSLDIRQSLRIGANEIKFTPKQKGVIPFSCSMGMIRGSFVVK